MHYLDGLSERQRSAVTAPDGPLLVTAGAGSGKTRTLTSRILHLMERGTPGNRIVAITFTNKAAGEMKSRILAHLASREAASRERDSLPFLGTFHSFGARILRAEAEKIGRTRGFAIFDGSDTEKTLNRVMKKLGIEKSKLSPSEAKWRIGKVKNELLDPSEVDDDETFSETFREYEASLAEQNALDFDDLLEKTYRLFMKRSEIKEKYRNAHDHILIDEYQDTNTVQYRLVKLLAENHRNLTVVGDDAQSIYGFRWSDFRNFLNFERDWPEARVVVLDENYRSSATIVKAASAVIEHNKEQRKKSLWTKNTNGEPVLVVEARNAEDEAIWIAERVPLLGAKGTTILYRTNAQSRPIEQALIYAGIPYEVFGGLRFYDRREVKDLVAALRLAANPGEVVSRERLEENLGKRRTAELFARLPEYGGTLSPLELIGFFLKSTGYIAYLTAKFPKDFEDRIENIESLVSFAGEHENLEELLERIALFQSSESAGNRAESGEAVRLMTIHLAKGLEFDSVIVAGAAEGILPHQRSLLKAEDLEEERRLIYVAMTRARERLILSFYGIASRFLYEIPPELVRFLGRARGEREVDPFGGDDGEEDAIYLD